ncbi:hypothetical protein [Phytoactinopolyspora limicola]|uniref:hypothetical protein n=1 Tax=Phytoactinopolyspora limicola TaxID=2715536 RepID=UPI00140A231D|nr:hypothetical protein [Phytoactinopolyspora limicola]
MTVEQDDMVPNPEHTALSEILSMAQGLEEDIAEALDDAFRIMDSGEAWTGPTTATTFLEDLGYRKDDLPRLAERLVEDIRTRLQNVPAEVHPDRLVNPPV